MNQSTFDILSNSILSQPRMMGTGGEKKTTEFLMDFLTQSQLKPFTEEIEWSTSMIKGRKLHYILIGVFICLLNVILRIKPPFNGIFSIILIPITIITVILFGKRLKDDKLKFLGKQAKGNNVICEIEPLKKTEKTTIVYLTAHSDSVASNMPKFYIKFMIAMFFGFLIILLLVLTSSIISLIIHYRNQEETNVTIKVLNLIILVVSIFVLLIIFFNMFGKRVNTSPGACDNGSGSSILLSIADHFKKNPVNNIFLKFIWCTAEEWGLYGSKGYVKAHKEQISAEKDQSYLINVDMVGSELAYLGKTGLIKRKPMNSKLNTLIEQTAKENEIVVRKFNSPIGSNSDHAPFKKEKIEVCCFLTKNDFKIIHSKKDTIDLVKPEKLKDAVDLLVELVEKIDSDVF